MQRYRLHTSNRITGGVWRPRAGLDGKLWHTRRHIISRCWWMTEWGHFSVIQVFTAVITAVRTIIRIIALSPPLLSTLDGGRLFVRASVFWFFWSLIHCTHCSGPSAGRRGSEVWMPCSWQICLLRYTTPSARPVLHSVNWRWVGVIWLIWRKLTGGLRPGIVCLRTFGMFACIRTRLKNTWGYAGNTHTNCCHYPEHVNTGYLEQRGSAADSANSQLIDEQREEHPKRPKVMRWGKQQEERFRKRQELHIVA